MFKCAKLTTTYTFSYAFMCHYSYLSKGTFCSIALVSNSYVGKKDKKNNQRSNLDSTLSSVQVRTQPDSLFCTRY